MSRKRTVLHSHERHRNRRYKRKIRNLIVEVLLIIFFVFVVMKFVKKDEEQLIVSKFGVNEQKQIIDNEMQEKKYDNKEEKELETPEILNGEIVIEKATINYIENINQTILNVSVVNMSRDIITQQIPINLVDDSGNVLEETHIDIQNLGAKQKIKINIVCGKNLNMATKIEIRYKIIE